MNVFDGRTILPRILCLKVILVLSAVTAGAQTADHIVAHYLKAIGGMDRIQAVAISRELFDVVKNLDLWWRRICLM